MGSIPQHPFFLKVIESLQSYDRFWMFPYITIMSSTGPLFLSIIWKQYMRRSRPLDEASRVRVLMPERYMHHPQSFFTHHVGNSWHRDDAKLIFWVRDLSFLSHPDPDCEIRVIHNIRLMVISTLDGISLANCHRMRLSFYVPDGSVFVEVILSTRFGCFRASVSVYNSLNSCTVILALSSSIRHGSGGKALVQVSGLYGGRGIPALQFFH